MGVVLPRRTRTLGQGADSLPASVGLSPAVEQAKIRIGSPTLPAVGLAGSHDQPEEYQTYDFHKGSFHFYPWRRQGDKPCTVALMRRVFSNFRTERGQKTNFCFLAQCILSLFTSRSNRSGGRAYYAPSPFHSSLNLLRPKIHTHFSISRLACIGEVLSPISTTNNFDFLQNPVTFQHCYAIIDKNPWRMKP